VSARSISRSTSSATSSPELTGPENGQQSRVSGMIRGQFTQLTYHAELGQTSPRPSKACHLQIACDSSEEVCSEVGRRGEVASGKGPSRWRVTYHVCNRRVLHHPLQPTVGHHLLSHLHHHRVIQQTTKATTSFFSFWTATSHTPEHVSHPGKVHSARSSPGVWSSRGWGIALRLGFFRPCFRIGQRGSQAGISWLDIEAASERGGRLQIIS